MARREGEKRQRQKSKYLAIDRLPDREKQIFHSFIEDYSIPQIDKDEDTLDSLLNSVTTLTNNTSLS